MAKKINQEKKTELPKSLFAAIRIAGEVKKKTDIVNTLYRLRLRKKYTCILINPLNKDLMGMLFSVRHSIAYGEINKETLVKLLKQRAKAIGNKKLNFENIAEELYNGKNLESLEIKPFFRLHPPRGGIKSKLQYPKGVLGNNKQDINKLIERML